MADVDAPEYYEEGFDVAKNFLIGLVHNRSVYLDIDEINMTDKNGRLVCVVYVDYNFTHVMNVNKALLIEDYAEIWDFPNEFNPYTWSLYCPIEAIPQFPSFLILPLFMMSTLLAVILCRRKHSM